MVVIAVWMVLTEVPVEYEVTVMVISDSVWRDLVGIGELLRRI